MANTISAFSNFAVFILQSEFSDPLVMYSEPAGWDEGSFKIERHKEYHGIFSSFTNLLSFRKQYKDYIVNEYELNGINSNLRLIKLELKDTGRDVKFVESYSVLADYKTMKIHNNSVEIRFNSNELEEIIKSHKSDTFELERLTSIDDSNLDVLDLKKIELSGRTITGIGESAMETGEGYTFTNYIDKLEYQSLLVRKNKPSFIRTKIISSGDERHVSVDNSNASDDGYKITASNMFFVNSEIEIPNLELSLKYKFAFTNVIKNTETIKIVFVLLQYNSDTASYDEIRTDEVFSKDYVFASEPISDQHLVTEGHLDYILEYNQGLMVYFTSTNEDVFNISNIFIKEQTIKFTSSSFYENSPNLSFIFFHDAIERLMYILTGEKGLFYSKYFGRTELGYKEDGEGGLIGLMSGFWARQFDPSSDRYKSLQTSLQNEIKSAQATFNIGVGVEKFNLTKRLRFEKLEYFYQDEVVVKLPYQLKNVIRTIDDNLFFSGTTIGYEKGGEYDENVGLDEPNTTTETVTPIRKSDKKFRRTSKTRSDDYGLELARRLPQFLFPDTDSSYDENNWWLDIKRTFNGFTQKIWSDRLIKLPTGVNAPEDYKGMFFTPLRMLLRHGFVLRAGLEPYLDKLIKNTTIKGNKNLRMHFIGEDEEYGEGDDILTNKLDRAKFLPTVIEGEHVINNELLDWLKGSTKTLVNGEYEYIPNVYFPIEFLNENEVYETGYLLLADPKGSGKFKFQKYNDKLIKQ